MAITESHLKPYIRDPQLKIPNYNTIRADRHKRTCGGVILYIHDRLISTNVETFDNGVCEAVICTLPQMNAVIASIYRPPDTTTAEFNPMLNFLSDYLDNMSGSDITETLIMGDLNFPNVKWDEMSYTPSGLDKTTRVKLYSSLCLITYCHNQLISLHVMLIYLMFYSQTTPVMLDV